MSAPRKPSAPVALPGSPPRAAGAEPLPARSSNTRAFLQQLAGMGGVPQDDPNRGARWLAGLVSLGFTAFLAWSALRGHRKARREGYRAGRDAARVAALPSGRRKR